MGKGALAFATGFGAGYLKQTQQNKLDAERQEDRDQIKRENADRQEERDRLKKERNELVEAGKTATVNENSAMVEGLSTKPVMYENADVASSDLRQDRRMRESAANPPAAAAPEQTYEQSFNQIAGGGAEVVTPADPTTERPVAGVALTGAAAPAASAAPLTTATQAAAPSMRKTLSVNGKEYADRESADAAAKTFNDGRGQRITQALYGQGEPGKAMQMDAATMELQDKKRNYAQKMLDEGAEQVATASRKGDADAVRIAANASGEYKIDGEIQVTPEMRTVPGLGDIPTFSYTFNAVGKDGKPRQMSFNSHDLSMQTLNFKEILKVTADGRAADDKSAYNAALAEARMKQAEASELRAGLYGGARGTAGGSRGSKADPLNEEINDSWKLVNEGATKLEAGQLVTGKRLTTELVINSRQTKNPIPPSLAAEVAFLVTSDPTLVQPSVNKDTGHINGIYSHPTLGEMVISRDLFSATNPKGQKTEIMKGVTDQYLATLPESDRQTMIAAANDPAKTKTLVDALYVQADQQIAARAKQFPQISAQDNKAWGDRYKDSIRQSLQRKINLVNRFGPQLKAEPTKKAETVANPAAAPASGAEAASPASFGIGSSPALRSRAPGMKDQNILSDAIPASTTGSSAPGVSPTRLGDDFESPGARAALTDRVRSQGVNGAPRLSDVELQRARQLGLI
jgi:hypothetical protein